MKPAIIAVVFSSFLVALAGGSGSVLAQENKVDLGKREYDSNCANCHGIKGKGDGPYKPWLTKSPPDLTVLTKQNGGVYPVDRVYSIIDGREKVPGHGPSDMPIWGRDYSTKARDAYFDVPYPPEAYVRTRILALTEYVARLQVK